MNAGYRLQSEEGDIMNSGTRCPIAVLAVAALCTMAGVQIRGQGSAVSASAQQGSRTVSGSIVFADGTKKSFSNLSGLERESTGPDYYQERFDLRPGKLFFEARDPVRIIVVDLGKVNTITFGKILKEHEPVDVQVMWKDGRPKRFAEPGLGLK
jgi:hypothetical protein